MKFYISSEREWKEKQVMSSQPPVKECSSIEANSQPGWDGGSTKDLAVMTKSVYLLFLTVINRNL